MMSGFVITFSRALRPGDWVRVGDVEGSVMVVGALSTKIATPRGEEVTIPNAVLVGGNVVNYSRLAKGNGLTLTTKVTIGYDAPWRVVHRLLLGAAAAGALVRKEPAPFVLQRSLGDFYVEYELFLHYERPEERWQILSDLHAAIQDGFNEAGIQIMSPNFLTQPDKPVLVPKEKWGGDGPPPTKA
jgi:small-conductance mechanosensitive channel